jgi:hypothetical protein
MGEYDENVPIQGDPENPLRELAHAPGGKDAKLDWIKKASAGELATPEVRDRLIQEASRAGATPEEIDEALDTPV